MDFFLGLVCSALALVLVYALPIVALVVNVRQKRAIEALERRIAELEILRLPRVDAPAPVRVSPGSEAGSSWGGALPRNAPPGGQAPRDPPVATGTDVAAGPPPAITLPPGPSVPLEGTVPLERTAPIEGTVSAHGTLSHSGGGGARRAGEGSPAENGDVSRAPASGPTATDAPPWLADGPPATGRSAPDLPPPSAPPPPDLPPPAPPRPPAAPPRKPLGADALGVWALAIPGGLALLLAAIFALREAIAAGLVGPGVRFALGAAVGAFALVASEIARGRRYDVPAAALGGGGAGVVYAVIYAGHARYGLIGQELAFGLMLVTTAITLFVAERRDSRFMATLALVGGYLTPILLSTGENKAVAFFGYLALLDAGLLVAATRRRWTTLILVAGVVTTVMYAGWAAQFYAPDQALVGLVAPALLGALFLALPARKATATSEAVVGAVGALLLFLAGGAYVLPAVTSTYDRTSSLPLPTPPGDAPWLALAYLLIVPGVALLVGVRRARADASAPPTAAPPAAAPGSPGGSAAAAPATPGAGGADLIATLWLQAGALLLAGALLAMFALGWSFVDEPAWVPVAIGLVGVPLLAVLARSPLWVAPLVLSGVLLGGITVAQDPPMALVAGLAAALGVLGAFAGQVLGPRPALVPALVGAALPVLAPLAHEYVPTDAGAWFLGAAAVYAAFAFPPFWRPRPADLFGALSAALAGPLLFFPFHRIWVETLGDDVIGVLPVLLGMVTLLAAVTLVRAVKVRADDRELAILVTVVLLFAAGAVPLQLEEAWLTVGWAVEVALLGAVSRRLTHPGIRVFAGLLALAVCVRLLLNPDALSYGGGEGWILVNWTLYTWGIPAVCLLVAARLFDEPVWFRTALRTAAVLLFFALVNLEVAHAFAHDDVLSFSSEDLAESMTRSIAWAAYGLLLIAVGTIRDSRGARLAGLSFALLGALKVFVVDLWSLSGFARVGSFAGLAVTLLIGAIAFQRIVLKDRKP